MENNTIKYTASRHIEWTGDRIKCGLANESDKLTERTSVHGQLERREKCARRMRNDNPTRQLFEWEFFSSLLSILLKFVFYVFIIPFYDFFPISLCPSLSFFLSLCQNVQVFFGESDGEN